MFVISCSNKKDDLDVSISKEKMANIIVDLNKAHILISHSDVEDTIKEQIKKDYKESICKHYGVNSETFDHDLKIYLTDDKAMKSIFDKTNN